VQKGEKSSVCNFRECLWSRNKTWKFCLFNPCRLLFIIAIVQANGVFYMDRALNFQAFNSLSLWRSIQKCRIRYHLRRGSTQFLCKLCVQYEKFSPSEMNNYRIKSCFAFEFFVAIANTLTTFIVTT
jgi:hypothetical protein